MPSELLVPLVFYGSEDPRSEPQEKKGFLVNNYPFIRVKNSPWFSHTKFKKPFFGNPGERLSVFKAAQTGAETFIDILNLYARIGEIKLKLSCLDEMRQCSGRQTAVID